MFIERAATDLPYFISVIVTVVLSITVHELAHGAAAIRLGDDTPRVRGHITLNPLVHMPPFALLTLVLAGIAWGSMPIDPSRLRGRYAEAIVAFAGPLSNLILAALALTAMGLWQLSTSAEPAYQVTNAWRFLQVFGTVNLVLFVFNLLPVPPLDGSHILANFHRGYRNFIYSPNSQNVAIALFIGAFLLSRYIFRYVGDLALSYVDAINGSAWTFVSA